MLSYLCIVIILLNRNPGEYNKKIEIIKKSFKKSENGINEPTGYETVLKTCAKVKTTSGFTLIINDSDFEKALTNFTIRYPSQQITRDMFVKFKSNLYSIQYLNNIDEANVELEIQAKLVNK